ncbi:hypothetical protein GC102_25110 [Paenibacillus sp. LMG 31460]|uniref:Polysaccharide biosynthesis protein n=1 Tax=Paenibacillus germinis TaxID=2654979 RepID=A0ABX1Z6T6_9BACL|nr:polysaccharide biosynthesis C-terminal domain-containing protein [Paenibacillus germinis]NOU89002.1 hypothetical protein [Paenibacillus germinis]
MIAIQNQIEAKYRKGAKVVLYISILAIPMQLLTSMIISRISAEASGTLGLVELFYNAIITFFLFGGETAIVKLLSEIKEANNKKSFILYYIGVCLGYFLIFAVVLRLLHIDIIKLIIGSDSNTSLLMYMVGVLIVIHNVLLSYQKEQEHFLSYSIGVKLFNVVTLFAIVYIYANRSSNIDSIFYYAMMIGYVIFIPYIIFKKIKFNISNIGEIRISEYKFLKYAFFLHASTVVAFLFDRMDQMLLLNKLGVAAFGGYYLVVKIVNMVKLIPNIYTSTFYPLFCKHLKKDNASEMFNSLLSKNLLVIVPIISVVILNSKLIMQILFGDAYLAYENVLKLFMIVIVIGAPGMILNNCLFALGKSKQYFIISSISVMAQLGAMFPLMAWLGVDGLVVARGGTTILVILSCLLYLKKENYFIKLSKKYFIYSCASVVLMLFTNMVKITSSMGILATIILLSAFIIANRASIKDMLYR